MKFSVTLRFFLMHLGARPALLIAFLAAWAFMLGYGILQFVLHSDGLLIFNASPEAAAVLVAVCIAITIAVFTWRTMNINRLITDQALKIFIRRNHRPPDNTEWELISSKLSAIKVGGTLFSYYLQAVRLMPAPNVTLSLLLMSLTILLKLMFELLSNAPDHSVQDLIFANIPWLVIILLFIYLLYHDVWSLEVLSLQVENALFPPPTHAVQLRILFEERLTRTERICVEKKYFHQLRNKEIAAEMFISESSVKTHINNINKKWEQFAAIYGQELTLRHLWNIEPEEET